MEIELELINIKTMVDFRKQTWVSEKCENVKVNYLSNDGFIMPML